MVALGQVLLQQLDPRASAATLLAPLGDAKLPITGTTTITSITAGGRGQLLLLEFASAGCVVTNGSNLKLRANYTSTAFGTLTLECDGTNWAEVSRNPLGLTSTDFPAGLWTSASIFAAPVLQLSGVSVTTTLARQFTLGKFVHLVYQGTMASSTGTAGNVIFFILPFSVNANSGQSLGTFRYDRTAGGAHLGLVILASGANITFMVPTLGFIGFSPNFAEVAGDAFWFSITCETT